MPLASSCLRLPRNPSNFDVMSAEKIAFVWPVASRHYGHKEVDASLQNVRVNECVKTKKSCTSETKRCAIVTSMNCYIFKIIISYYTVVIKKKKVFIKYRFLDDIGNNSDESRTPFIQSSIINQQSRRWKCTWTE